MPDGGGRVAVVGRPVPALDGLASTLAEWWFVAPIAVLTLGLYLYLNARTYTASRRAALREVRRQLRAVVR